MPHLAAASSASAHVAFLRPGPVSRPQLHARAVRRDLGAGLRMAEQPTFYDLLGISSEGTLDEVRAAYRRMALKYHPDISPPAAAAENTRRFIEAQEAYETLSDHSLRATYDRALARGVCRVAPYYQATQRRSWRRRALS